MSVIIDALQTKEQQKAVLRPPTEGLFFGPPGFEQPAKRFLSLKYIIILLAIGITAAIGLWSLSSTIVKKAPVVALVPATVDLKVAKKTATSLAKEAESQIAVNNLRAAIKLYEEALIIEPSNADIHNNLGLLLIKVKKLRQSEMHIRQALALNENCAPCLNNLGYLKTLTNAPKEAEELLLAATKIDAQYPDPYFNLGVLYERNDDIGSAIQAYEEFLEKQPNAEQNISLKIKKHIEQLSQEFASGPSVLVD